MPTAQTASLSRFWNRSPIGAPAVEAMEKLLERMFVIPGINRPVGLDVILDLVPGIGDVAAAALGGYIVWEARNLGMSKTQIARMAEMSDSTSCWA